MKVANTQENEASSISRIDVLPHNPKKKALEAAVFVVLGFGLSQVVRLAGNIVLTRLLVPELFGIVSLARVFLMGLYLFSDIGLEPAIIRSKRSNDPDFLNTVWTIQILRGVILALIGLGIAFPVAAFYKQPDLAIIIPVICVFSMISSSQSTSLVKFDRELQQKTLTILELIIQLVSLVCMVVAALFLRNVWALLVGEFVGSLMRTAWSHVINKAQPNKFFIEKETVIEVMHFGKWIFLSTAVMFLASQVDRMLLGKFFSMTWFGIYSIAVNLAELPKQVILRLSGKVIYPLITKFAHLPREELRAKIGQTRGKMLFVLAATLSLFACFGDLAVHIIFDERYGEGKWILPMLAIGMWPLLLILTIESSLYSIGKPKYAAMGNLAKFLYMVVFIPLLYRVAGVFGAVLAVACNDIPAYIMINIGLAKEGLALKKQDAAATAFLLACTGALIGFRFLIGIGMPGSSSWLMP